MKILSYECHGSGKADLSYQKINLRKRNLIVGVSGSGKTRFINSIFNAGHMAAGGQLRTGFWDITFEEGEQKYRWLLEVDKKDEEDNNNSLVVREGIWILNGVDEPEQLVSRDEDKFTFEGDVLPRLSRKETSISLLRDENAIKPLHRGFSSIMRRQFSSDVLNKNAGFSSISVEFLEKFEGGKDIRQLFSANLPLSAKLFILSQHFSDIYSQICREFISVFPFVSTLDVLNFHELHSNVKLEISSSNINIQSTDIGNIPVFALKEKNVDKWIPFDQWSSGMQKVLLIITDILLLPPEGGVYLLDEYENSLGVNAIHFLPSLLLDYGGNHQFFITSHHPYLINKIPVRNWFGFRRSGTKVIIEEGEELERRFNKSRQEFFVQLDNDPIYIEGIE